jgi:hypothetical protein
MSDIEKSSGGDQGSDYTPCCIEIVYFSPNLLIEIVAEMSYEVPPPPDEPYYVHVSDSFGFIYLSGYPGNWYFYVDPSGPENPPTTPVFFSDDYCPFGTITYLGTELVFRPCASSSGSSEGGSSEGGNSQPSSGGSSSVASSSGCNCPPFVFNEFEYTAEFFGGTVTTGVITDTYVPGTNDATIVTETDWYLSSAAASVTSAEGEVSFGVACSSVVGIEIASGDSSTTPNYIAQVFAYIDGVPWPAAGVAVADMSDGAPGAFYFDIPITADCSVITLVSTIVRGADDPDAVDGICAVEAHILYVY